MTTVAVGSHGILGSNVLQNIATQTGGKYYEVNNANALPKIYQREARRIARPLVYEPKPPVSPQIVTQHEIVQGLGGHVPADQRLRAHERQGESAGRSDPALAAAERGGELDDPGRVDLRTGQERGVHHRRRPALDDDWTGWDDYDRFFSQMVRWSMRPTGDTGKFTVATDVQGSKTRVVITALDKDDEFLNYQTMTGTVLGPNMESIPLEIEQTAPGRYVGEFDSAQPGSYMIMVTPGAGQAMIRTGVNVGYSAEFRDRETNAPLLESLAKLAGQGRRAGQADAAAARGAGGECRAGAGAAVGGRSVPPRLAAGGGEPGYLAVAGAGGELLVSGRRVRPPRADELPVARAGVGAVRSTSCCVASEQVAAPETMSRLRSRKAEVDAVDRKPPRGDAVRAGCRSGRSIRTRFSGRGEADGARHAAAGAAEVGRRRPKKRRRLHVAAVESEEASVEGPSRT